MSERIESTIHDAATRFGVPVEAILAGRKCRNAHVVCAREWIIRQHPEMSSKEMAHHLRMANHSSVLSIRKRLQVSLSNTVDKKTAN